MDIRDIDKLEQAKLLLEKFESNLPREQFYPSLSQNRHRAIHAIRLIDEILKEKDTKADKLINLHRQCLEALEEINEQECPVVHRQLYYATTQLRLAAFNMKHVESEKRKEDCTAPVH